jgi:two-component system, OmpR family, phosphate regulon sensor histidine kinase PhoR
MPLPPQADSAILEHLPDPVMVVQAGRRENAAERQVVFANGAARSLFRLAGEPRPLITLIRNPKVLEAVDASLFEGADREVAYDAVGAQDRHWLMLSRPLDEGRALVILRDQTDARRSERLRADFLANASHELRTPLASLTGFIETLRGHAKDDSAAREHFLSIMQAQAERMARLIDDLLSLSRIELNEHIAPSGTVDLAGAAADVISALAPQITEGGVTIDFTPPAGATVEGDRDQIVQVLQNLVDNAVKYTPPGGTVSIAISPDVPLAEVLAGRADPAPRQSLLSPDHDTAGRYVAVRVTDQGPGIARQHLPRLSERFYRAPGQKSGERNGTGLGLAIVKHIMNRHRGGLAVESAEGQGAAFTVYFPA